MSDLVVPDSGLMCDLAGEVADQRGADGKQPGALRPGVLLHAAAEACGLDPARLLVQAEARR